MKTFLTKPHPNFWLLSFVLTGILIAFLVFQTLLPAQAAPPIRGICDQNPRQLHYLASGPSIAASGTITGNTASDLEFATARQWVYVSNRTGSTAYVSLNRASGTYTTSTTVFDFVLDDGEDKLIDEWLMVESLTVYVSPTTGFRAVGW